MTQFVPPLLIDRVLCSYSFEDRGFIAVVGSGAVPTSDMLDVLEQIIQVKRIEIAAAKRPADPQTGGEG